MRSISIFLAAAFLSTVALAGEHPHADRLAEREAEVLEWIAEKDSERHDKLVRLEARDPERYRQAIKRAGRMMRIDEFDPKALERRERMREIRSELTELGTDFDEQDKREQTSRRAAIEALAEEGFELRLAAAEMRVEMQEAKLTEAREKLAEARSERDERIEEHVQKVVSGQLQPRRQER